MWRGQMWGTVWHTLPEQNRGAGALAGNETRGLTRSWSASCAAARSLKYPESSEDIMSDFKVGVSCTVKKEHLGNNAEDTLARDETGNRESGDQSIKDESNSSQDPEPRTGGQKCLSPDPTAISELYNLGKFLNFNFSSMRSGIPHFLDDISGYCWIKWDTIYKALGMQ